VIITIESKKDGKEKVYPPPGKVGKKDKDADSARAKVAETKESPKMAATKPGMKRPSSGTSFGFGSKKKQSGISIQLQPQV